MCIEDRGSVDPKLHASGSGRQKDLQEAEGPGIPCFPVLTGSSRCFRSVCQRLGTQRSLTCWHREQKLVQKVRFWGPLICRHQEWKDGRSGSWKLGIQGPLSHLYRERGLRIIVERHPSMVETTHDFLCLDGNTDT